MVGPGLAACTGLVPDPPAKGEMNMSERREVVNGSWLEVWYGATLVCVSPLA